MDSNDKLLNPDDVREAVKLLYDQRKQGFQQLLDQAEEDDADGDRS